MTSNQRKYTSCPSLKPPAPWLLVVLLMVPGFPGAGHADDADIESSSARVQLLLKGGAYDLALRRLNNMQAATADPREWLEWENLRYELYRKRGEWDALADRLIDLPPDVPDIERQELMTHAAELLLDSGSGDRVREILRALIWRGSGDSRQLNYWRRLVVRSYLVDDSAGDARIAMSLYERDYLPADADWSYLFAQVLLRQGDPGRAAQRLGSAQEPAARVLRLLSRLRAGVDSPELVMRKNAELRDELPGGSPLRAASWAVSAEAALDASDGEARVDALEHLFNGPALPAELTLFRFRVSDLWEAYETLGEELGNTENLLLGESGVWMALAERLEREGASLQARAVNAITARRARTGSEREQLHLAFYNRLTAADLDAVATRLYESEAVFPAVDDVPDTVRHRMVAAAIEQRDMKRAARYARHLAAPGSEQTQLQWDLTRARLALYAGDFDQSESILRSLILSHPEFDGETADRVMQPVFDLQSVGRNQAAFELFQYMRDRVTSAKHERELLLWMGDARKGEGAYETAAEYYLRSAYAGSNGLDQWGQSARYHAAEALTEARFFEDARRIYEQLLSEVGEGKQAAALRRRLQELWVREQEHVGAR